MDESIHVIVFSFFLSFSLSSLPPSLSLSSFLPLAPIFSNQPSSSLPPPTFLPVSLAPHQSPLLLLGQSPDLWPDEGPTPHLNHVPVSPVALNAVPVSTVRTSPAFPELWVHPPVVFNACVTASRRFWGHQALVMFPPRAALAFLLSLGQLQPSCCGVRNVEPT